MAEEEVATAVIVFVLYYCMFMIVFLVTGLTSVHEKKSPRFKILVAFAGPVTWFFYVYTMFRGIARHLYYGLRYNRTYKQEIERREHLIERLS